jgi:RimJ/RimL family protein N-acetyltransferase
MEVHLTKTGEEFIIRRPTEKDAQAIIDYARILFASTDQVLTTLEEYTITLEEEKVWINNALANPAAIILVAALNDQIVGLLDFSAKPKKKIAHIGEFGVSVHPRYQGVGIGRKLVETLVKWAKEHPQIEKVFLNVFDTNTNAIKLYKALGFSEEGRHIRAAKQLTGEYCDIIQMYLETK